jgi:hypothetical protein
LLHAILQTIQKYLPNFKTSTPKSDRARRRNSKVNKKRDRGRGVEVVYINSSFVNTGEKRRKR